MRRSLIITALLLLAAPTWAANLVTNPSFETDTNGWSNDRTNLSCEMAGSTATFVRSADFAHAGSFSVKITTPASYYGIQYAITGVTVGQSYTATGWIKGDGSMYVAFALANVDSVGCPSPNWNYPAPSSSWQQVTSTVTASTATIYVLVLGTAATFYADDFFADLTSNFATATPTNTPTVTLTPTPTITPTVLLTPTKLPTNPGGTPQRCGASGP